MSILWAVALEMCQLLFEITFLFATAYIYKGQIRPSIQYLGENHEKWVKLCPILICEGDDW